MICQALLAGLSLYPLIASCAGNVHNEEFLTGYGPGSRSVDNSIKHVIIFHSFYYRLLL